MKKNKLPGFTLADVLIGMMISAIVLASAYAGFERVTRLLNSFRKNSEKIHDITLLNRLLLQDFTRSKYVSGEENSLSCVYKDKQIVYIFDKNYIVRRYSRTDTFALGETDVTMIPFSDSSRFTRKLISECEIRLNSEDSLSMHFRKDYASDILLSLEKE